MPIVQWNIGLTVGIKEIDEHHKCLVELLNKTYDEFREGCAIELPVLDRVIEFATDNFACEEGLMTELSYPEMARHQEEHALFRSRIAEFRKDYRQSSNITVEILWFLCNWVTHHIRETDNKFGRFFEVHNFRRSVGSQGS